MIDGGYRRRKRCALMSTRPMPEANRLTGSADTIARRAGIAAARRDLCGRPAFKLDDLSFEAGNDRFKQHRIAEGVAGIDQLAARLPPSP
jgi:hypothetical protein